MIAVGRAVGSDPAARRNVLTMNLGCLLIYFSVYIEKGIALIIPGYTPDTLGQIYRYTPSATEIRVAMGVFSIGFLMFTLMVRVAVSLLWHRRAPGPTVPHTGAEQVVGAS